MARHFRQNSLIPALLLCFAFALPANANPFTWDLSTIGIAGATPFSADALKATENTHISITGPTTFLEHGFAQVTGILNGNVVSTPAGLNSSYSLYFEFVVTGSLVTQQFSSFSMDLYAVDGVTVFGYDANDNATVSNGANVPILIATNTLVSGSIAGIPFVTPLSADAHSVFTPTAAGAPVFISPLLPSSFHGAFSHPISDISPAIDGGFKLTGGDDTLTLVPEISSLTLLLSGIPLLMLRRRR